MNQSEIKWTVDNLYYVLCQQNSRDIDSMVRLTNLYIKNGVDANDFLENGETILTDACKNENTPIIIALTEIESVDFNKKNKDGRYPIECCSYHYDIKILEEAGSFNPYKVAHKARPLTADFSEQSIVALATMLASNDLHYFEDKDDFERYCLKAWSVIKWYLNECSNINKPFKFDDLTWYYENSEIHCFYHDYETYTDEERAESKKEFQNYVEEMKSRGYTNYFVPVEELKKLKDYSFTQFRVSSRMTHQRDEKLMPKEIYSDSVVLILPKEKVPTAPLESVFIRENWR